MRTLLVTCIECHRSNSLDSKFCRACGHALPPAALTEAREANDQLVTEGFKLLADGRHDEAFLVAENALTADPTHIQALSLKGDVLERRGELAEAFLCYEKVVELSPDSALDRIKLDHVRRMLAQNVEPVKPNRRAAVGAAVATTGLVACIGISLAVIMSNRGEASPGSTQGTTVAQNFPATSSTVSNELPQAKPRTREDFDRLMREAQAEQANSATAPGPTRVNPPKLPDAQQNGNESELSGDLSPMRVNVVPTNPGGQLPDTGRQQPQQQPQRPSVDPDPTPEGSNSTSRPTEHERPNPGTVDIRPSQGNPTRVGNSETIPDNQPSAATLREVETRARQFFNAGDYAKAAAQYERALTLGANPARTSQRLGQCYERLGKRAEAIRAYENAVRLLSAQLQSNPESDTIKTSLEACNQALSNLRG